MALEKKFSSTYLYKDVFKYGNIRKPKELEKIVTLLAWQAGTSSHTVDRYIDLLRSVYYLRITRLFKELDKRDKKEQEDLFL